MNAIVMTKEYWANTPFSVARYYGLIKVDGQEYVIVDKRGHDIFECSAEAEKAGREKAIEPGEPADLCRTDFVPIYRKLGREQFLSFIKSNPDIQTLKDARARLKKWEQETKNKDGKQTR